MTVSHVEILVEEPSMEAALRSIVPRIIGNLSFEVYPFQGKTDLLRNLISRLKGYSLWLPKDWRIVVIVDRDDDDCHRLKKQMEQAVQKAGLISRTKAKGKSYQVANRLAIEELEAWYFGDWKAVMTAYPKMNRSIPNKQKYRDPDAITGGTCEAMERLLKHAGFFKAGLRKIELAKTVARHMDPMLNRSHSFCLFRDTLIEMV